jgi:EAL domain-containing protein (putative c-di-GMP-specific phosphodiesterase class I)
MTDLLGTAAVGHGVVSAFQRVVSLPSETVVGYEALARWPAQTGLTPLEVFAHAEKAGDLDALDHACITAAARGALQGNSSDGMLLLVNCEPTAADLVLPDDGALAEAASSFRVVFELTERGLLTDPGALLRKVGLLRSRGFLIALDDVGAHRDSLALLDIVAPDIVKLDLGLVQHQPDRVQARTVAAVMAHHERTGALILAEGIETDEHLEQALAYGATLGQGYRFGRPGELDTAPDASSVPEWTRSTAESAGRSVFDLMAPSLATRVVRKRTLLELSRHIERLAEAAESAPIVLTTVQKHSNFNLVTRRRYTALAERSPLVLIFGVGVPDDLEARVRWVDIAPEDPLSSEWIIVVLGPHTAAALIAQERLPAGSGPSPSDGERRFEAAITFDRVRVTRAARTLMARLAPHS